MGLAAEVNGLDIPGRGLDRLIEPDEGLVGLAARELDGGDRAAGGGLKRVGLQVRK